MTFREITDECIALRFEEPQRGQIKNWINNRYAALWGMFDWTFRRAEATCSLTAGTATLNGLPGDFGVSFGVWLGDGTRLEYLEPDDYNDLFYGVTDTGAPYKYTVFNQVITVGPIPATADGAVTIRYERRLTPLIDDSDLPMIPTEHHYVLVPGALSMGLALYNDFTYQFIESMWQEGIQTLQRDYLIEALPEIVWKADTGADNTYLMGAN